MIASPEVAGVDICFDCDRVHFEMAAGKRDRGRGTAATALVADTSAENQVCARAIDAGARVVLCRNPYVVQQRERYRDGAIFYSPVNLVFGRFDHVSTQHALQR
jgi:hypothetical protein